MADDDDGGFDPASLPTAPAAPTGLPGTVELGVFSLSLAVADLDASRRFYEALGFEVTGGDAEQNWLILKNGETTLGLFHGMFDSNMLTFNPGLTPRMERLESFTDVREIAQRLTRRRFGTGRRPRALQHRGGVDHLGRPRRQPGAHRSVLLSVALGLLTGCRRGECDGAAHGLLGYGHRQPTASCQPQVRTRGPPMDNALRRMLNQSEWDLLRETEPARLRKKSEDDLVELHTRVRRARNKYSKLYRRRASAQVKRDTTKGKQATHQRTARKAELFEDARAG